MGVAKMCSVEKNVCLDQKVGEKKLGFEQRDMESICVSLASYIPGELLGTYSSL